MGGNGLFRHSAQYLVARGLSGLINLGAFALFTRLLSPEEYGRYALVIAGVGLVHLIVFSWLKLGLLRFLPGCGDAPAPLLSTVAGCYFVLIGGTAVLATLAAGFWSALPLKDLLAVGLGLVWAQTLMNFHQEMARARLRPDRYGHLMLFKALLGLVCGGLLAWLGWGAQGVLLGYVLSNLVPSFTIGMGDWQGARPWRVDSERLKELLAYGLPLSVTAALAYILAAMDRFMIKGLLDDEAVGLYASGYDLSNHSLAVVCLTVGLAATPLAINALEKSGWDGAKRQFLANGELFLAVVLPACAGLLLVGEQLVDLVVGAEFRAAARLIFPWILLGSAFQGIKFYYLDSAFYLHKKTALQAVIVLPAAVCNVVLNFMWLPQHGYMAAAWSTMTSYALALVLTLFYVLHFLKMPFPVVQMLRTLLATGLMAVAVWSLGHWFQTSLYVEIPVGVLCFGVGAWWFKVRAVRDLIEGLNAKLRIRS